MILIFRYSNVCVYAMQVCVIGHLGIWTPQMYVAADIAGQSHLTVCVQVWLLHYVKKFDHISTLVRDELQ